MWGVSHMWVSSGLCRRQLISPPEGLAWLHHTGSSPVVAGQVSRWKCELFPFNGMLLGTWENSLTRSWGRKAGVLRGWQLDSIVQLFSLFPSQSLSCFLHKPAPHKWNWIDSTVTHRMSMQTCINGRSQQHYRLQTRWNDQSRTKTHVEMFLLESGYRSVFTTLLLYREDGG